MLRTVTTHQAIFAIDRAGLNKRLLDILDALPNVQLLFNHKLTGADFRSRKAWFEVRDTTSPTDQRPREIEINFDLMIGADGAHSAVRYHMMKFSRMDYQQQYIDTLWCEFHIPPQKIEQGGNPIDKFRISPNHLHIWPGKEFMFIAIPSEVSALRVRRVPGSSVSHVGLMLIITSRTDHSLALYSFLVRSSPISRAAHHLFSQISSTIIFRE